MDNRIRATVGTALMTDARAAANHARQRIGCSERASERATRGALPPPDTLIRKWMAHFHVSRPNTLFFRQHSNVQDCHKGQVSPLSWNGVNERTRIRASHLSVLCAEKLDRSALHCTHPPLHVLHTLPWFLPGQETQQRLDAAGPPVRARAATAFSESEHQQAAARRLAARR